MAWLRAWRELHERRERRRDLATSLRGYQGIFGFTSAKVLSSTGLVA